MGRVAWSGRGVVRCGVAALLLGGVVLGGSAGRAASGPGWAFGVARRGPVGLVAAGGGSFGDGGDVVGWVAVAVDAVAG